MLEKFRQWSHSWVAKILLGVLVASFGLFFGMADIFHARHPLAVVATVGQVDILTQDLHRRIEHHVFLFKQNTGKQMTSQQVAKLNIPTRLLSQMIHEALLDQEVERMKLAIADEQILFAIQNDPRFKDEKGLFSRSLFERFLRAQGMHENTYVTLTRKQLKRAQLVEALLAPLQVPPQLATLLLDAQLQKRYGAFCLIKSKDQKVEDLPDEKKLRSFYDQYTFLFKVPERRSFTLLLMQPQKDKKTTPAAEKDLEKNKQEENLYALGKKVDDALASGETLEEVSKSMGLPLVVIDKVDRSGSQEAGKPHAHLPPKSALQNLILQSVFTGELKTDTHVMRTPEGEQFVIRLDEILPEETPAFEAVQDKVKQVWMEAQQNLLAQKAAKTLAEEIENGDKPSQRLVPLPAVSLEEKKPDSIPEPVLETLFKLAPGEMRVVRAPTGAYVVQLIRIQQPSEQEKAAHRPDFEKEIVRMLRDDLLQGYLQSLKPLYPVRLNEKALHAAF